jgi:regulator of protease activity HflC (stomatin/prohibitin superfamily)
MQGVGEAKTGTVGAKVARVASVLARADGPLGLGARWRLSERTVWQRGLLFRLGRYAGTREPGLTWIVPFVDRLLVVDIRVVTQDIEPQETMTNDNVPVKVKAVVWYKVVTPEKAIIQVRQFDDAVRQTAPTTLRSVIGQHSLDELLKEQDKLSQMLGQVIDKVTEPWGVAVDRVQIKDVEIPQSMQRAMAQTPLAIELRRMQMLTEVGAEQNTMTIVMMPSEFVSAASALTKLADRASLPGPEVA